MAVTVGHLAVEELEARYRAAADATGARHFQAIWLLAQGRTFLGAAEVLAFAPRRVEALAARYNASGPDAPGDRRRRDGRAASLLAGDALAASAERLRARPDDGGVWTGPGPPPGWRGISGRRKCTRSAVGRRCNASGGRSRRRGRGIRARRRPRSARA